MAYVDTKIEWLRNHSAINTGVYRVYFNLTNVTSDGVDFANANDGYTCTLTPNDGYYLPYRISIEGLTTEFGYTYDHTTGYLYIPSSMYSVDIVITAEASEVNTNVPAQLEVAKITADTATSGSNTYEDEYFFAIDVYPSPGCAVDVTYGDLTKTVIGDIPTDTDSITPQTVYFGTLYGVTDEIETPDSGILTISGSYESYRKGKCHYDTMEKSSSGWCNGINKIIEMGSPKYLYNSFNDCANITEVTFSDTVEEIQQAFEDCTGLASITWGEGLKRISNNSFSMTGLTSITFPASVTDVHAYATSMEEALGLAPPADYEYGGSLTISILFGVFPSPINPSDIVNLDIDANNEKYYGLQNCIFERDTNRLVLGCNGSVIPDSTKIISYAAFASCKMETFDIPEGVTEIYPQAFACTSLLTDCTLPSTLTRICYEAFAVSGLTSIAIPEGITEIEPAVFYSCSDLVNVSLPSNLVKIGYRAFYDCKALTEITLPSTLVTIGEKAFESCTSLTSITLPQNVSEIGVGALSSCSALTDVTVLCTTPPTLGNDTVLPSNVTTITVPAGYGEVYKAAEVWSNFADIIVEAS